MMIETNKVDGGVAVEMISFLVGGQNFCVDVMSVREIRVWTPATPVAHAPNYVCGVINLRGAVLPIIDLAVRLGFAPTEPTTRHAILVAQIGGEIVGLLVEGVSEIITVNREMIQPTPNVASELARTYISGIVAIGGRMVSLVATDALLPPAEQRAAA